MFPILAVSHLFFSFYNKIRQLWITVHSCKLPQLKGSEATVKFIIALTIYLIYSIPATPVPKVLKLVFTKVRNLVGNLCLMRPLNTLLVWKIHLVNQCTQHLVLYNWLCWVSCGN